MKFTAAEVAWVRGVHKGLTPGQIASHFRAHFGRRVSAESIKALLYRHRLRKVSKPKIWPDEVVAFVAEAYRRMSLDQLPAAIEAEFGIVRTLNQVRALTRNRRIRSGRTGRFVPGQPRVPGSGAKGPNRTSFKKGRKPEEARNYRPVGSVRRSKDGYWERKVTDDPSLDTSRRWVGIHRLVWEEHYGPIPAGHKVIYIDGDYDNVSIDNLALVSSRELVYLNKSGLGKAPAEIKPTAIQVVKLVVAANKRAEEAA